MNKKINKKTYKPSKNEFVQEYLYIEDYDIDLNHHIKQKEKEDNDRGTIVIELF